MLLASCRKSSTSPEPTSLEGKMRFCIAILLMITDLSVADKHTRKLLEDLLKINHYSKYERPLLNASDKVRVTFGMALHQFIGLKWTDVNLDWEPSEYGDIREIRVPIKLIWKPDIILYNSADTPWDRTHQVDATVYYDGTVVWSPPSYIKSSCKVIMTYFPFDDQVCRFKYSAWTHDYSKLDLINESNVVDTRYFTASGDWNLTATSVFRNVVRYDCCVEEYVDITFSLHLRRRTLSYGANLIIPTLLTSMMAILVFTLPSESGEKVALDISVLLSLLFCLQMLGDRSPPTSESVPLLGLFFLCCTILVALSIVMSIIVLNHHHSDPDTADMNELEKLILLHWLPKLVGVSRPALDTRRFAPDPGRKDRKRPRSPSISRNVGAKILKCDECEEDLLPPCTCGDLIQLHRSAVEKFHPQSEFDESSDDSFDQDPPPTYASIFQRKKSSLREIRSRLRRKISERKPDLAVGTGYNFKNEVMSKMVQRIDAPLHKIGGYIRKTARDDKTKNDWQFAARAIDRLCLYLFFGLIVSITAAFYFKAPHIVA